MAWPSSIKSVSILAEQAGLSALYVAGYITRGVMLMLTYVSVPLVVNAFSPTNKPLVLSSRVRSKNFAANSLNR